MPANIKEFIVGSCSHPECMGLKGASLKPREYPARAYLIESGDQKIMCDTGYSPRFFERAVGIYKLYAATTPVKYDHDTERLDHQLLEHGVRRQDIDTVFVSHFHADHVSGLRYFSEAAVVASEYAWESLKARGFTALLRGQIPGLTPYLRQDSVESRPKVSLPPELAPFAQGFQLDQAGDVVAVALPGHARGHMGCFVRTQGGWELLAFDAAWDSRAYTQGRGPSELSFLIQHDKAQYYDTLNKLRQLHSNGVAIRLSHAPREG